MEHYCSYRGWIEKLGYNLPSWKRRFLVMDGLGGFYYTAPPETPAAAVRGSFRLGYVPAGPAATPLISTCTMMTDQAR